MRQIITYWLLPAMAGIFSMTVTAQHELEELYGDEEWIAISTGTKKPIYKAPAVANVITADDIKRIGATTLDEILETVPGIHVALSLAPAASTYIIRGFGGQFNSQVLTLVNGVGIDTALNGGRPNAFYMPVANIERIEIIRGPGSAVYGADAYAGVINIITKNAESGKGTQAGVRTGSFETHEFWLTHGGLLGAWDFYFGLDYQTTEGDDERMVTSDLQSQLDTFFGTSASLAPGSLNTGYTVADMRVDLSRNRWRFRLSHLDISDAGVGPGVAQALDNTGKINSELSTFNTTYHNTEIAKNWDFKTIFAYTHMDGQPDFQILPPGANVPIGSDGNLFTAPSPSCPPIGAGGSPLCIVEFTDGILGNPYMEEEHYRLESVAIYDGITNHRIRVGAGIQHQELKVSETKNFGPGVIDGTVTPISGILTDVTNTAGIYIVDAGQDRRDAFLSIQDEWSISNDWELTSGLRYDNYSDFGHAINPRIALVWQTSYNLTSKLLYGRAFRAPSFNEQFAQNNPIVLGNNTLEPETIDTLELVLDYRPTLDSQLIFNTFVYDADDLIRFVRDATGASTAQNTEGQEGYGIEIEANQKVGSSTTLYANYSYINVEDKVTKDKVADVPTRQFYITATWSFLPQWTLTGQAKRVAGRERLRRDPNDITMIADTREEIDDYVIFNSILRKENLVGGFDLAIAIRNIFDEEAHDPSPAPNVSIPGDFPLAGRSYYIEGRFHF